MLNVQEKEKKQWMMKPFFPDRGAGAGLATPDLDDVKESVRQGVSKVAGRLSNMASGVFTSLQVIGTLNNINPVKVLS
jgi:hypothetical protein